MPDALLGQPFIHHRDRFPDGQPVEKAGVDHNAGVVLEGESALFNVAALDDLYDLAAELPCKLPVAVVVRGNCHDSARAVGDEDIVGDEDGYLLAVDGVYRAHALEPHAGLFLVELGALKVGLVRRLLDVGGDLVPIGELILPRLDIPVLRREDHVCRAEERVGAGGVDDYIVAAGGLERDLRAGGAPDPVALLRLDALDIIHGVKIVDKALGVLGDGEHPLALLLADDLAAAALAHALHHFLVGQHALAAGTPVHGHGGLVGKTVLKELQKDPLGPLVILGVGGVHAAVPVEAVAQHLQLAGEILDVLLGDDGGMDVVLMAKFSVGRPKAS